MIHNTKISMIAAIGKNRELGKGNKLIWNIPSDLQRFREITRGHPVIMGRKTYQSINRLLPHRTSIIVTQDPNFKVEGAVVVHSLADALGQARGKQIEGNNEVFIIGGGQIFSEAIKFADKLYLTVVDEQEPEADAFFPDYSEFKKIVRQEKKEENGLKFEYLDLER